MQYQWVASWMTLKSSEVKNFLSWRVSTILKSFHVASASHLSLPYIIRPTLRVLKFVPTIIFQSPEFRSRHLLLEVVVHNEKSMQSYCHWIEFLVHFQSISFTNRYSFCRWASSGRSSRFCFGLWSACKSKHFRIRCGGFLLIVVVLLVDQICDQLVQSMRNSDPRVRIVFVYRFNSNFHSIFTLQITGCDFQHGSNFGVPLNPTFRLSWIFVSWQSVLTTLHWFCKLWELVSVLCHEVLNDFNCFQESCLHTSLYHSILLWKLSTRSLYFCNKVSCAGISIECLGVVINKSAGAKSGSDYSATTSVPVLVWQPVYSSHTSLRLLRRYRHRSVLIIFHLLCFWAFLETLDSWLVKLGVRFLWIWSSSIQRLCPILLVVCQCRWNTILFLIQVRRMTNVLLEIFLQLKSQVWR